MQVSTLNYHTSRLLSEICKLRHTLTKFGISDHTLEVEMKRHKAPFESSKDQWCSHCDRGKTEREALSTLTSEIQGSMGETFLHIIRNHKRLLGKKQQGKIVTRAREGNGGIALHSNLT